MFAPRTNEADDDLFQIWRYIAGDNPEAAESFVAELESTCHTLFENPMLGRDRSEECDLPGMRSFPHKDYTIYFQSSSLHDFLIIRILHASRDITDIEFSD